jgi:hypothetical protein
MVRYRPPGHTKRQWPALRKKQRDAQRLRGAVAGRMLLSENEGTWTASSAVLCISYERWCNQNGVEPKQQRGLDRRTAAQGVTDR